MSSITQAPRLATYARFVKIEHTLFSLPMLFAGACLAARGFPGFRILGLIVLAGTGARIVALALNRIIDRRIDGRNPRTAVRELPQGAMSLAEAAWVTAAGLALYLAAAWFIAPICALLSPLPLAIFVLYPTMKRFTPLAHLGVGAGLAVAPLGAWMAVRQTFAGCAPALWLGAFTLFWVAGFDIIYATQDEAFDRAAGLYSLPAWLGAERALRVAAAFHLVAFGALAVLFWTWLRTPVAGALLLVIGTLLALEHRRGQEVERAFFTINAWLGFVVLAFVLAGLLPDLLVRRAAAAPPAAASAAVAPADTSVWKPAGSYELTVTNGPGEGGHVYLSRDYKRLLVVPDRADLAWILNLGTHDAWALPVAGVEFSDRGAKLKDVSGQKSRGSFQEKGADILWQEGKTSYVISPEPPMLGEHPIAEILQHKKEYAIDARDYTPDPAIIAKLHAVKAPHDIVVFFGTWCPSCRHWLPRFLKSIQAADNPNLRVRYIAVDANFTQPPDLIEKYNVHMTPSFIILKDGVETGRIKGHPGDSMESDLLKLCGG